MSMSPSLTQTMVQRQTMTMSQRHAIKAQQTMMQIELVATLRDERYEPRATCPKCGRSLAPNEILAGFLDVVDDFTTECTGCHHRFEPLLICFGIGSQIEVPFYCGIQAKHLLREVAHLPPSEIARKHPGEYRSAVVHYGTLVAMFATLGIAYDHVELEGWQGKIMPFLGRMPDVVVAKCAGVSVDTIRKIRTGAGIGRYTKAVALAETDA